MALDLDKIKEKIEKLNNNTYGSGTKTNKLFWRPQPGKQVVRTLPWKNMADGEVYPERWFYYNIVRGGIVAPDQFNQPDPVKELRIKCYEDGGPEMRELAKNLHPRMKAFVPVIVRGQESEGVKLWGVSKTVHAELLGYYLVHSLNKAKGGIADLEAGFDIDVEVTKIPNSDFYRTKTDVPRDRDATPLSKDPKQIKEWLSQLPDIDELYPCPTYDEVKTAVDRWFESTTKSETSRVDAPKKEKETKAESTEKTIDEVFESLNMDD